MVEDKKKIAFVHVPKCAGLSIAYEVEARVDESKCLRVGNQQDYDHYKEMNLDAFGDIVFFSGHVYLWDLSFLGQPNWSYVSMIREPIDRYLSIYNYHMMHEWHPRHEETKASTVEDYLVSLTEPDSVFHNEMCIFFSEHRDAGCAIENIKAHLSLLTLSTDIRPVTNYIANALSIDVQIQIRHNESVKRVRPRTLSPNLIKHLKSRTQEDYKLYEWLVGLGGQWVKPDNN